MNYSHIIPEGSFLHNYMQSMAGSETSQDYDLWGGLWLISLACGRDVVVARPSSPVFLNLYVIFVADSGITRKSTAVRAATKLASELVDDDPTMGLLTAKATPEKLDAILHQRSADHDTARLAISISELATFVGTERYNAHMPQLLTDLFDCPGIRSGGGTIGRGQLDQRGVWISFISASTPSWLLRSVNPNIVAGGFASRCMFIVSEAPKTRIAWGRRENSNTEESTVPVRLLLTQLQDIRTNARHYKSITANEAAIRSFETWYKRRRLSRDAFNASFESREDAHVLRLAGLLSINDGSWVIQRAHIAFAIKQLSAIKSNSYRIFAATRTGDRWVMGFERLRDALNIAGHDPLTHSALFLKVRGTINNDEYSALLDVLHEVGCIQRYTSKHEGAGRPATLIRGTKLLNARGTIEQVVGQLNR